MERIIILGASGFIGSHLQKTLLAKGFRVKGFSKEEMDLTDPNSEKKLADFFSIKDIVIFLSSIAPDKKDPNSLIKNIQMALTVSRAIKKSPIQHLIYFSSEAVYEFGNLNINEESPTRPDDEYGAMHLMREVLLSSNINLNFLILRLAMVYGREDNHCAYGLNKFQSDAFNSCKINIYGLGEEMRDCIYIKDLIRLVTELIVKGVPCGILNIATGISISYMDLAKMVASAHESDIKIQINERKIKIQHKGFNIKKINDICPGFNFTNLRDGIEAIAKNYKIYE